MTVEQLAAHAVLVLASVIVMGGAHTAEKKLIRRVKHIVDVAVNADGGTRLRRIDPTQSTILYCQASP